MNHVVIHESLTTFEAPFRRVSASMGLDGYWQGNWEVLCELLAMLRRSQTFCIGQLFLVEVQDSNGAPVAALPLARCANDDPRDPDVGFPSVDLIGYRWRLPARLLALPGVDLSCVLEALPVSWLARNLHRDILEHVPHSRMIKAPANVVDLRGSRDEYLSSLKSNRRRDLTRLYLRLDEFRSSGGIITPSPTLVWNDALAAHYVERWAGLGDPVDLEVAGWRTLLPIIAKHCGEHHVVSFSACLGGSNVMQNIAVATAPGEITDLLCFWDPAFASWSPGLLAIAYNLDLAREHGFTHYDLCGGYGDETNSYKSKFINTSHETGAFAVSMPTDPAPPRLDAPYYDGAARSWIC